MRYTLLYSIFTQNGPVLKITCNQPLKCIQEEDGSISIKLSPQSIPSDLQYIPSDSQSISADSRSLLLQPRRLDTDLRMKPSLDNVVEVSHSVSRSKGTNGSTEQHVTNNRLLADTRAPHTPPPPQKLTINMTERQPVPRPRRNSGQARPQSVERSTSATVTPVHHQTLPRSNTVGQLNLSGTPALHAGPSLSGRNLPGAKPVIPTQISEGVQLQLNTKQNDNGPPEIGAQKPDARSLEPIKLRSQTLPSKSKRNQSTSKESGGPTNELQALLAKRRAWEQS